jgi:hypothetical protein
MALLTALVLGAGVLVAGSPSPVEALSCVRIIGGKFDAEGNDNLAANLNGEYVKIKNFCSATKSLASWRLHDYQAKNTYVFSSTFRLGPGATVYVFSGRGTNTAAKRFWGRTYGAVWNNTPPEAAYLRSATRVLISAWTPYGASATPTPVVTPPPTPKPTPDPMPTPSP